jgi:hypothetical protein
MRGNGCGDVTADHQPRRKPLDGICPSWIKHHGIVIPESGVKPGGF